MFEYCHKKTHFISKSLKKELKLPDAIMKKSFIPVISWQSLVPTQSTITKKGKLGIGGQC
jgi:hypothetical protein